MAGQNRVFTVALYQKISTFANGAKAPTWGARRMKMPADFPFAGAAISSLPSVYLKRLLHDGVADQSVRWEINTALAERERHQRWGGRRVAPIFRISITTPIEGRTL